jgi:putative flippase GtrA
MRASANQRVELTLLQRLKIFIKAQLSALIGVMADYGIMIFLSELAGLHYTVSTAIGCTVGAVINFSLNKTWTFHLATSSYKYSHSQQQLRYVLVVAFCILLKVLGTYAFESLTHLSYKICRIIADLLVAFCFSYTLQRWWVFRRG